MKRSKVERLRQAAGSAAVDSSSCSPVTAAPGSSPTRERRGTGILDGPKHADFEVDPGSSLPA